MTKYYFVATEQDTIPRVYREITLWFKNKEYEVESTQTGEIYLVQAKKTGFLRTLSGTNLAFRVTIYWSNAPSTEGEFIIETRVGKWFRNITGAGLTAIFTSGFTIFTGFAGAGWALVLERDLINHLQNTLNFKRVSEAATTPSSDSSAITVAKETVNTQTSSPARSRAISEIKAEIDQLQSALNQDIISQEEFQQKKQKLEKKIDEREVEILIEEKTNQLQEAFASGVLDADEYEAKLNSVEESAREKLSKKQKFKKARDDGILTEEEYQAKLSQL